MSTRIKSPLLLSHLHHILDEWVLFSFSKRLKFGIKVSLSLMLAYMIPLGMGWAQASTAAMTVMLIATAGVVGESIMKGAIRVVGTLIGALIGLSLIALFPQDRMTYLLVLSIIIPLILYLYHVYQGDGTVFMLMSMTIMMVFKGGEVDGTFLYGIDKTFMTIFGIVIYTLVGLFLWPIKQKDSTIKDALSLSHTQNKLFDVLLNASDKSSTTALIDTMNLQQQKLQSAYVQASGDTLAMALNAQTWDDITKIYDRLSQLITLLALHTQEQEHLCYEEYLEGYTNYHSEIDALFRACKEAWQDEKVIQLPPQVSLNHTTNTFKTCSNIQKSAIITQAELLRKVHLTLTTLVNILNSLNSEKASYEPPAFTKTTTRFVWLDPEYLRGIVQTFLIFWFATAMWIFLNPPGGFIVVTLAVVLSVMTSFSILKPSVITTLFSIGFIFAITMYVAVLPNLVYAWQLALFIFFYTFIAFYLIKPKMSIFFLLGMFTLGIDNTMHYNFDLFLTILLMFYLFLSILMLFYYLPFSTKPETLFVTMTKRLFHHAAALLNVSKTFEKMNWFEKKLQNYHTLHLLRTTQKLKLWAGQIDTTHFNNTTEAELMTFVTQATRLHSKIELLVQYQQQQSHPRVYTLLQALRKRSILSELAAAMVTLTRPKDEDSIFQESEALMQDLERRIDAIKETVTPNEYSPQEVTELYVNIALRHSIFTALSQCHEAMQRVDFEQLQESRF